MAHAVDMEGDFIAAVLDNGSQIAIVNWKTKAKVYIKMVNFSTLFLPLAD